MAEEVELVPESQDPADRDADYPSRLGPYLRTLRKQAGLTLDELARQCGLSQPFLSQIETGRALPSLLALHRVANAVGTSAHDLLQPEPATQELSVIRAGEGERYVLADGATVRFLARGSGHRMEPNEVVTAANVEMDHTTSHEGEEMVYVVEGSVMIEFAGSDPIVLHKGDAATYPSKIEHRWASGPSGARFLMVCSPPSF